jgi:hypothetical protein
MHAMLVCILQRDLQCAVAVMLVHGQPWLEHLFLLNAIHVTQAHGPVLFVLHQDLNAMRVMLVHGQ